MKKCKLNRIFILGYAIVFGLVPLPLSAATTTVNGALGDLDGSGDGTTEAAVLQTAVACWDTRIATVRNFTLNVTTMALTGARGTGAVSALAGGIPTAGGITIDDGTGINWFVDPTPLTALEFTPDPNNQWRFINGTVGSGAANADLLRAVMHEIGHASGWICGNASCGRTTDNFNYDGLMNPQPANFVNGTNVALQQLPGFNVTLRGDGLGAAGAVVNELSHVGPPGPFNSVPDMMFGRTNNGVRESHSNADVSMYANVYGDLVNLPLTVNAGANQVSECNAAGGSNVMLDATGSTDPENDALTYSWTCPAGIALTTPNNGTTSGFFPLDQTTTCRVDATDQAACPSDADQVSVMVVDTTDPGINCPANTTVECAVSGGTAASDPGIAGFLSGATASDACDVGLSIGNNGPGFFNLGSTSVTFSTTDDSNNSASCSANLIVEDTIDPDITAPADITAECAAPGGTSVMLGMATTSDICDGNLAVSNDAPALFPLGPTPVLWTAEDDSSNQGTDSQIVTIEDTIPPELELSLSETVLWAPNHKLVTITATVVATDICDADPEVTLVSVTSNEPDNGRGDGNTTDDIVIVDDFTLKLRAERSGPGSAGRFYTVTYQAEDDSGNVTERQAVVTVPKSMKK